MDKQRISYPVRTMRMSDAVWRRLRLHKFMQKMTWNRLLDQMVASDETLHDPVAAKSPEVANQE